MVRTCMHAHSSPSVRVSLMRLSIPVQLLNIGQDQRARLHISNHYEDTTSLYVTRV
jgi:transcriptional regulator of met regulon